MSDVAYIPLVNRSGDVVARAAVCADDAGKLSRFTWRLTTKGYAVRYVGKRPFLLHREVMGAPPCEGLEIDHINRAPLDNRRENLRWVTHAQNLQNKRVYRNSKSGVRGVYFDSSEQRWVASVKQNGRHIWRRRFSNIDAAAAEVSNARRRLMTHTVEDAKAVYA